MIGLIRAIRTLNRRREELKTAVAEHSIVAKRVIRVADEASKGQKRGSKEDLDRQRALEQLLRDYKGWGSAE